MTSYDLSKVVIALKIVVRVDSEPNLADVPKACASGNEFACQGADRVYCSLRLGLFLRVFRRLVSERRLSKVGVTNDLYRFVNAFDHVNSFSRVETLTMASLSPSAELDIQYAPFRVLHSWNLNAFAVFYDQVTQMKSSCLDSKFQIYNLYVLSNPKTSQGFIGL